MKKTGFYKSIAAFAIASALILAAAGPRSVLAYFTTHAEAKGVETIKLFYETTLHEDPEDLKEGIKRVSISSEEGSIPLYVRVKVFSEVTVNIAPDPEGSWTAGTDGYWYCNDPLMGGDDNPTADLVITIADDKIKEKYKEGDVFDVIVVYEVTPVIYEPDDSPEGGGNPKPKYSCIDTDWERDVEVNTITEKSSTEEGN